MKTKTALLLSLLLALTPVLIGQEASPAAPGGPTVKVPAFANTTCPVMAKPASEELFFDTDEGRIYICCIPCVGKIRRDVPRAMRAAYPAAAAVDNRVCPISGKEIQAGAPTVTFQGLTVSLCCEKCVDVARRQIQVTLVKATNPKARVVGNPTCPVTGNPVDPNLIIMIDDAIVHVADAKSLAEVKKDPTAMLKAAEKIAADARQGRGPGGGE